MSRNPPITMPSLLPASMRLILDLGKKGPETDKHPGLGLCRSPWLVEKCILSKPHSFFASEPSLKFLTNGCTSTSRWLHITAVKFGMLAATVKFSL